MSARTANFPAETDATACCTLVRKVAESQQFRKSPRQRDLFLYLCQQALDHPGVEVKEQRVGMEAFGRSPGYDTSQDTIVRVHTSDLRKRLKAYFETGGADSPVLVEIPKGGYTAVFTLRPSDAPVAAPQQLAPVPQSRWRNPAFAASVLAATLLAWWGRGLWEARSPPGDFFSHPALALLWSQFNRADQRTFLVVADSVHGLLQDLTRHAVPLAEYAGRNYWRSDETDPRIRMLKSREYSALADLELAGKIAVGYGRDHGRVQVIFARHFQMRWLNTDNAILVGSKRSNPWGEVFEPLLNFQFDFDEATGRALVRNRKPRPGEQSVYAASIPSDETKQGYAVVAYLPNLRRTGNVLILAGTSSVETDAAGYFATTEEPFAQFVAGLPAGSNRRLPYFEVLLKTLRVAQSPRRQELVAYRLLSF